MTKKQDNKFAVIRTGGKQYIVREGDTIKVEKLSDDLKEGASVNFDDVLLVAEGENVKIGEPTLSSAKVEAKFIENAKDKKISVIRFRAKSRYFKNKGHRQNYSKLEITKIAS